MSDKLLVDHQRTATLQQGEVRGYDFNRMTVKFTMLYQGVTSGHDAIKSGCPLYPDSDRIAASQQLTLWAMCGRLRVGKSNHHVAAMVGAAMCSAFECGSHDRWP